MAHVSTRDEMPDLEHLTRAMLKAAEGQPMAEVAQAALDIALGIWALSGDVTQEMAMHVIISQVERRFKTRSH